MKINFTKFIYLPIAFALNSCISFNGNGCDSELSIYNNTDSAIYVYLTSDDSFTVSSNLHLFDTLHIKKDRCEIDSIVPPKYRINAYSFYSYNLITDTTNNFNDELKSKDYTINIFFVKENTLKNNSLQIISENKLYSKKISLWGKSINSLNVCLVYSND